MSEMKRKRDRTARLLRLQMILWQNSQGVEIKELSRLCSTSLRTAYRDMQTLETELKLPIWEDGNKRGIDSKCLLPPINFTISEAMNIFLAARALYNYLHEYNPNIISTLYQLNSILPSRVQEKIHKTVELIEKLPVNNTKVNNINKITDAWLSQHSMTIKYQDMYTDKPSELVIDPYVIEPGMRTCSIYITAYCHQLKSIHSFNFDSIVGDVRVESEIFEVSPEFHTDDCLFYQWRNGYEKLNIIKLHFTKRISNYVALITHHPSQQLEYEEDGSVTLSIKANITQEFCSWILGWGSDVEVLKPLKLRHVIAGICKNIYHVYSHKNLSSDFHQSKRNNNSLHNEILEEITDNQWNSISKILPPQPYRGRHRVDDRRTVNGILWILDNNGKWADLPRQFGAPSTCNVRYKDWLNDGVWEKIQRYIKV